MDTGFKHLAQGYKKLPLKVLKIQFFSHRRDLPNSSKINTVRTKSNFKQIQTPHLITDCILSSLSHCAPMTTAK